MMYTSGFISCGSDGVIVTVCCLFVNLLWNCNAESKINFPMATKKVCTLRY